MKSRALLILVKTIGIAFSYWIAVSIGKAFSIQPQSETGFPIMPFWPAAGIALAAALIFGYEAFWGIALGLILSMGNMTAPGGMIVVAGKILAPFVGAYALRKSGFQSEMNRSRDVLSLLLIGAIVAPVLSATLTTLTHVWLGKIAWANFAMYWIVRVFGDALGIAVVLPLVFVFRHRMFDECTTRKSIEATLSLIILSALFWLAFSRTASSQFHDLPYVLFALILLCLQRFRRLFGIIAVTIATLIACWGSTSELGPFANNTFFFDFGSLFIFLGTLTVSTLMTSAVIRERELADQALQASDSDLRSLFSGMRDTVVIYDREGRYLSIAPTSTVNLYKSPDERLGRLLSEVYPNEAPFVLASIREALETGKTIEAEYPFTYNSKDRWFSATFIPRTENTVTFIAHDSTERKRATDKVQFQATLLEAVQQSIVVVNQEKRIIYWNHFAEKLHGWTEAEVINREAIEVAVSAGAPPEAVEKISHILTGQPWSGEILLPHRNGQLLPILLTLSPVLDEHGKLLGIIGTETDLTERKKLEEQLRQSQKLEAIGKLAGGVAHDFNNLLTAINGYSHMLLPQFSIYDARRDSINEIRLAGERAAELTQQLLAFSRKQILQPRIIDLNDAIRDLKPLLQSSLHENTQLLIIADPASCKVKADPGQITQVILNLVVNARDAMPAGGTLLIETQITKITPQQANIFELPGTGNYVRLMVSDTGTGMDKETQARIFEPFFTTKEQGKGTGLGLATVHGIVHQSGGSIQIDSQLGNGTIFSIYLPVITNEPSYETKIAKHELLTPSNI